MSEDQASVISDERGEVPLESRVQQESETKIPSNEEYLDPEKIFHEMPRERKKDIRQIPELCAEMARVLIEKLDNFTRTADQSTAYNQEVSISLEEDPFDARKVFNEILREGKEDLRRTTELVTETANVLIKKQRLDDFTKFADEAIESYQGDRKKLMLALIIGKCGIAAGDTRMLQYYLALEKLLNDSNIEKELAIKILLKIRHIYFECALYKKSLEHALKAEKIADELENMYKSAKIDCCSAVGNGLIRLGEYKNAIEYFRKGLAISTEIGDRSGIARNNENLGNVHSNLGEYVKAIELYNQSLMISTELKDHSGIAASQGNLGNAYLCIGQYEKAIEYHERSLKINSEVGDRSGIAESNRNLGNAYCRVGQHEKAIRHYNTSLAISTDIEDLSGMATTNANLGGVYLDLCQYEKAIEHYNKGLEISTAMGDRAGIARRNGNLGNAYLSIGHYEEAIDCYNKDLSISSEIGDRTGIAASNANLGNAYLSIGQYEKAIECNNLSLAINVEIGDRSAIAANNRHLGNTYLSIGQYEKAIEYYNEALGISTEIGDPSRIAKSKRDLGDVYFSLREYDKAIEHYNTGLGISTEIGDRSQMANNNGNLGNVYFSIAQYEKAIECYNKGLAISTEIGDRSGIAIKDGNLGNVFFSMGQYEKAIEHYRRSLSTSTEIGDVSGMSGNNGNLGNVYFSIGQYKKAIEYYKKGLTISTEIGDLSGIATNDGNLGNAYRNLGQYKKAIECYNKGLESCTKLQDRSGIASNIGNLGNAYFSMGKYEQAIEYYNKGLAISTEIGDRSGMAVKSGNLGNAYFSMEQYEKAIEFYNTGLSISTEMNDRSGIVRNSGNLGNVYLTSAQFQKAIVLESLIENKTRESQFLDKLNLAKFYFKKAIKCADEIFSDLDADRNKISYINGYFRFYVMLMSCFVLLGRIEGALLASDLGKAKALHASIEKRKKSSGSVADYAHNTWQRFDNEDEKLEIDNMEKALQLQQRNSTVLFYSFDLDKLLNIWILNGNDGCKLNIFRRKKHDMISASAKYIFGNLARLLKSRGVELNRDSSFLKSDSDDAGGAQKRTKGRSERIGDESGHAQISDLRRIKNVLHQKFQSCGHMYVLLSSISDTSTKVEKVKMKDVISALQRYDLSVDVAKLKCAHEHDTSAELELQDVINLVQCHDLAIDPTKLKSEVGRENYFRSANDTALRILFRQLIWPVENVMVGSKHVIIVPDVILFFVPFCALSDENGCKMSKNYSIQITPSLHTLCSSMLITEHEDLGPALFVGNPLVGKINYRGSPCTITRLARSVEEVRILSPRFCAKPLVGSQATKSRVLKFLGHSSLVHIAAHGDKNRGEIFLSADPEWKKQGLDLPNEDFCVLREEDVIEIHIKARLVVLSCCHTGRGKVSSEGVIGLARSFVAAGARSVLVTLWAVDDKGTKVFMRKFYNGVLAGISVCEALRSTMVEFQKDNNRSLRKFSVWAPFTIVGEDVRFSKDDIEKIKEKSVQVKF